MWARLKLLLAGLLRRPTAVAPRWNGRIGLKVELQDSRREDRWYGEDENNLRPGSDVARVLGILLQYLKDQPKIKVELQSGELSEYRCGAPERIDAKVLVLFAKPIVSRDLPSNYVDIDIRYGDRHRRVQLMLPRSTIVFPRGIEKTVYRQP